MAGSMVLLTVKVPVTEPLTMTGKDLSQVGDNAGDDIPFIQIDEQAITDTPKPTISPLADGQQTYYVHSGKKDGPGIRQVTVSNLNTVPGESQQYQVFVVSPVEIDAVIVEVMTDAVSEEIALQKNTTTDRGDEWTGAIVINDTHDVVYQAKITATAGEESATVELMFR